MATWPSTLPQPTANFGLNPQDQTVRTDMEGGAARVRRRSSARNDRVTVALRLTAAQFATLRAWFDDATTGIAGGAAWFAVDLPVNGGAAVTLDARFMAPFKATLLSGYNWDVSAEWELR
jgi:hypothetical protein